MKQVTRRAYAKINLGLDVLKKRADGYHEVRMIMQTVGIYDELVFTERGEQGIRICLTMNGGKEEEVPCDEHNLIYKAAKLITETYSLKKGLDVSLTKNIPVAAGMAGGSADAAAAILGMNELFGLSMEPERMRQLAVRIGADVPYCLMGGTALAEGIGEILTGLKPAPDCHLLVVKPDIGVSTGFVYGHLDAAGLTYHPDIDGLMECLERRDAAGMADRIGNVLETVTIPAYPVIRDLKEEIMALGARNALMSGSGPTVFGIFDTKEQLEKAYGTLEKRKGVSRIFMTGFVADINA